MIIRNIMTLGAYIIARNEEDFLRNCIEHILPFVDQLVLVNHGSTDSTKEIMLSFNNPKVSYFEYEHIEPVDMGAARNFANSKITTTWVLAVDADEVYPASEMRKIREFIETAEEKGYISARFKYKNLAWRSGYSQVDFGHYPDRLYRYDVIDGYFGLLPNDMMKVKTEHLLAPNKKKGDIAVLEYDNEDDQSFIHPKQPIIDVTFYHLARTRGYNFEYEKNCRYNRNLHPDWNEEKVREMVIQNQWVSGRYDMEPIVVPDGIPTKTIPRPKVSVAITNFEYEKYVGEAIESALNQSYRPHEIVVVDDCSYDNSRAVIDRYPVKKIYRPQNGGPAAARNEGIASCTGDYFILLDADDRLKPNAIEELLKEAQRTDAEVVYPDMFVFGGREDIRQGVWEMPDYTPEGMLQAQLAPSVCALIDRHAFDAAGGFDITCMFEDWEWYLNLSHRLKLNFKHIPIPLLEYRTHPNSRSDHGNPRREETMQYFRTKYPITC